MDTRVLLETLLEVTACIDAANRDGATALFKACQRGRVGVVRLLLDNMATVDYPGHDGTTPLIIAANNGHMDVVELARSGKGRHCPCYERRLKCDSLSARNAAMWRCFDNLVGHSSRDHSSAVEDLREGPHACDARQEDAQRRSLSHSVQAGESWSGEVLAGSSD